MAKQRMERKFGEIPDWAKTGPIDLKNYNYRCEAHCAQRSVQRGGMHPTITLASPDFRLWHEYFAEHLGGLPWCMGALIDKNIESMVVPEQVPQWFDPSFAPTPGYRPVLPSDPVVSPEEAERIRRSFAGLLRSMGRAMTDTRPSRWNRYTEEQLRAIYATRAEPEPEAAE